ncbi:hypothetical protein SeMB42_g06049 [Synchytrium endobioticum]|uniref:Uncharacterized protein n=1 Tax=Synchytrium endobioticum TaxID=286115 RepID=A0A507CMX0_9FUNG|nr:hypothetical protein SeLEV6574_g07574 [Synchytrium endobioticum]TPX40323.1 hypothetical protein SeMB42_g06049 [Synchytrium endobioticum]
MKPRISLPSRTNIQSTLSAYTLPAAPSRTPCNINPPLCIRAHPSHFAAFTHQRTICTQFTDKALSSGFVLTQAPEPKGIPSQKDLMVVLGWYGSNSRNIRHYVSLNNRMGFDTVTYISPATTLYRPAAFFTTIQELTAELASYWAFRRNTPGYENAAVRFHILSNNGMYVYSAIALTVATQLGMESTTNTAFPIPPIPPTPKFTALPTKHLDRFWASLNSPATRVIIDSAPAPLVPDLIARGQIAMLTGSTLGKEFGLNYADTLPVISPMLEFVYKWFCRAPWVRPYLYRLHLGLRLVPANARYLFLYGGGDRVISAEIIEFYIKELRQRGLLVKAKRFDDSAHVQHLRTHPDEYTQVVRDFNESPVPLQELQI